MSPTSYLTAPPRIRNPLVYTELAQCQDSLYNEFAHEPIIVPAA